MYLGVEFLPKTTKTTRFLSNFGTKRGLMLQRKLREEKRKIDKNATCEKKALPLPKTKKNLKIFLYEKRDKVQFGLPRHVSVVR